MKITRNDIITCPNSFNERLYPPSILCTVVFRLSDYHRISIMPLLLSPSAGADCLPITCRRQNEQFNLVDFLSIFPPPPSSLVTGNRNSWSHPSILIYVLCATNHLTLFVFLCYCHYYHNLYPHTQWDQRTKLLDVRFRIQMNCRTVATTNYVNYFQLIILCNKFV